MAYPVSLDNLAEDVEARKDNFTGAPTGDFAEGQKGYHAQLHNDANEAINAIEKELGLNPSGEQATLTERLEVIESLIGETEGITELKAEEIAAAKVLVEKADREAADVTQSEALNTHAVDTTSVHGITDTSKVELTTNKVQTLSGESETEYPSEKAVQAGLATKPTLTKDTDGTLAGNSDSNVATQKATKTYADTKRSKAEQLASGLAVVIYDEGKAEWPARPSDSKQVMYTGPESAGKPAGAEVHDIVCLEVGK